MCVSKPEEVPKTRFRSAMAGACDPSFPPKPPRTTRSTTGPTSIRARTATNYAAGGIACGGRLDSPVTPRLV